MAGQEYSASAEASSSHSCVKGECRGSTGQYSPQPTTHANTPVRLRRARLRELPWPVAGRVSGSCSTTRDRTTVTLSTPPLELVAFTSPDRMPTARHDARYSTEGACDTRLPDDGTHGIKQRGIRELDRAPQQSKMAGSAHFHATLKECFQRGSLGRRPIQPVSCLPGSSSPPLSVLLRSVNSGTVEV